MENELKEIRNELLIGVENEDLLYIKMQINKLDTLIYSKISETECKKKVCDYGFKSNKLCNFECTLTGCQLI